MTTDTSVRPATEPADGVSAAELTEILAVTHDFAEQELVPRTLDVDLGDADALAACWSGVREIGLDRALLAEDDGGIGLGVAELLQVLEVLAAGDAGIATLALLSNAALRLLPAEKLAQLGENDRCSLVLLPEQGAPGANGLKFSGETTATGRIEFALGAIGAAGLVVVVPSSKQGNVEGQAYLVDSQFTGYLAKRDEAQLGLRSAQAAAIELSDTRVDAIGDARGAHEVEVLLHAGIAAIARGIARRAHALALDYAENRFQGGSMIVEHGAVRDMLALISERNRVVTGPGTFAGATELAQAIALKTAVTDAAVASTIDAVQVFGGMGYMHETGVEKLMRDAKYCQLFPQSNWLARDELVELERG